MFKCKMLIFHFTKDTTWKIALNETQLSRIVLNVSETTTLSFKIENKKTVIFLKGYVIFLISKFAIAAFCIIRCNTQFI